ncbi:MAG: acyl-CoA dehydrogenase [Alphaproteobacteria bacterium]|nr:acyl-CoA dehydrogenase [Rhodospirillales bacterium]MCW9045563.1 acyl-CoA dehydrogenase [Alphaproteobacteria bacterium]
MTSTLLSRRDLEFLLYELFDVESLNNHERYSDHNKETFNAVLDTAEKLAVDHFEPHAAKLDEEEPTFDGEKVHMIPEVKEALTQYYETGMLAATHEYDLGGMQLPMTVAMSASSYLSAANVSTMGYPFLSGANANVIKAFGTEEQKNLFLEPLLTGRYMGTMALTEPQAGSSLSDIKTSAVPGNEGTYLITGNKIFISAGDHELSENIVHLVLAKIKGAPPGVKGISLFIVPKYMVNDDGSLGERNDVSLAGLIHKMGYRGTTSTMLNFGENGGAKGYLVGEPHKGLSYMFMMMNEARIGVGLGAAILGYTGYLHALKYARERPQGRHPQGKDANSPQVSIIEHTDVKRMLLAQKASVEGGLALCLYGARLLDDEITAESEEERKAASLLLEILTPVIKSWPSQHCLEASSLAIQVHGGYGYTREYPVERLYRDNRLNPIHEGTHGIQSLDLLGRKVMMNDGAALKAILGEVMKTVGEANQIEATKEFAESLKMAVITLQETTLNLARVAIGGNVNLFLANSALYLEAFGHLVVAWIWLKQGIIAAQKIANATKEDQNFYQGKLAACTYFFRWELPKIEHQCKVLSSLDPTCLEMQDAHF